MANTSLIYWFIFLGLLHHVWLFTPEEKLNPPSTLHIPPFIQYLNNTNLDWLISDMSALDDKQCNRDLYTILEALSKNEMWAKFMIDSNADFDAGVLHFNSAFLGDYEECLWTRPTNFTTQYCLLGIDTVEPIDTLQFAQPYNLKPFFYSGKCLPSSCSRTYLNKILSEIKIPFTNTLVNDTLVLKINEGDCSQENENLPFTTINYITMAVLIVILIFVFMSTMYEVVQKRQKNDKLNELYVSFSLLKNLRDILLLDKKRKYTDTIPSMKAMAALLIIGYHAFYFSITGNTHDKITAWRLTAYNYGYGSLLFNNVFSVVDNFLFISGVTIVLMFLKDFNQNGKYEPVFQGIKRYITIMTPLFFITLIRVGISERIGDGPLYNALNNNLVERCVKSIWPTIFVYHNYKFALPDMCFQHSWYLPVDVHLFVVSNLIFVAASWNLKYGLYCAAFMTLIATTIEFVIGYIYDLGQAAAITMMRNIDYDYGFTHTRATPWMAGMAFGFILHKYQKRKLTQVQQLIGWFICALGFLVTYYGIGDYNFKNFPQPYSAIYLAGHKLTWALFLSWIIYASKNGCAGSLNRLMNVKFLHFLGNISYEMFILHVCIHEYFISTARDKWSISPERVLYHTFAITAFAIILATPFAAMVTKPTRIVITYLIKGKTFLPIRKQETESTLNEIELSK